MPTGGPFCYICCMRTEKTLQAYEQLCIRWESFPQLKDVPAKQAARFLGCSPGTLVKALNTLRPGAYDPSRFKHQPRATYVYNRCAGCGRQEASIRLNFASTDEAARLSIYKMSFHLCNTCASRLAAALPENLFREFSTTMFKYTHHL